MNRDKLEPVKRFRIFNDSWIKRNLSDVLAEPIQLPLQNPNKFELLTVKLHCNGIENSGKYPTPTEKGRPYYRRFKGELMIGKQNFHNGGIGIVKDENDGKIASNAIISLVSTNADIKFIFYYISRTEYYLKLSDLIGGTGQKEISRNEILKLPIIVPSLSEQQKIADCLSSLDDVITAQTQKLDLLKAHKKGLMQDLFPAEGESVPRLRFGEFEGNWIEKPFGEFATFSKGKGISKSDIVANGRIRCIRYGELYTHYGEVIGDVISRTNITESDLVFSQANDVIIPSSGETSEDIATASCVLDSGIALGGDLNIIRSEVNGIFLAYYLSNAKKWQIAKLAQGNSVVHLYNNQLQRLNICLPATKEEQQKIADCLSSLDEQIQAQTQKIESLKLHKKGLMQQLFPNPNP